jgi:hypothetical protein
MSSFHHLHESTEWGKLVDEEDAMLDIGYQKHELCFGKSARGRLLLLSTRIVD